MILDHKVEEQSLSFFVLSQQEVLLWIKSVVEECGENISKDQLKEYVWKTLNSGKVKYTTLAGKTLY